MLIPFPFQKGMYAITEPVFVPEDADDKELEKYRQLVEKKLNNLTWQLDKEMGLPFIPQGKKAKKRHQRNNESKKGQ